MKGITPKICRLCVYVIRNKFYFESFMCLDLILRKINTIDTPDYNDTF